MKQITITLNGDNKTTIVVGDNERTGDIIQMSLDGDRDEQLKNIFTMIKYFW